MIFLIMVVVIIATVALWNFDLHEILYIKVLTRNADDGAALAAARWQGITLNLLGELNVAQAVAINNALLADPQAPNFSEATAIADLQARVCFAGPMMGFATAQPVAKNNGVYVNPAFTAFAREHADTVKNAYKVLPPPYVNSNGTTCWDDYADMISTVVDGGVAAMPSFQAVGSSFYTEYHILLDKGFYGAIGGSNWCWFVNHSVSLSGYSGWQTWSPLPPTRDVRIIESEYLPLNIVTHASLDRPEYTFGASPDSILQKLSAIAEVALLRDVISTNVPAVWYCYDPQCWTNWSVSIAKSRSSDAGPFPFEGTIRSQYDYAGADVKMTVTALSPPALFNQVQHPITRFAAAKVFGFLAGGLPPQTYGVILPAYQDVRLIPYGTASAPESSGDIDWIAHILEHLPIYMRGGPDSIRDFSVHCSYCRYLIQWEETAFRQAGISWLSTHDCNPPIPPPPSGGGGGWPPPASGTGGTDRP